MIVDKTKVLNKAQQACAKAGVKLTEKRKRVLSVLIDSPVPLSAYEVADKVSKTFEEPIPPMSVYRMLDFLIGENLAHKLNSENKFLACSHIACDHGHKIPQFLICNQCRRVSEITIDKAIVDALSAAVEDAGFALRDTQLELPCLCADCKSKK